MKKSVVILAVFAAITWSAVSSYAGVGVNINIGIPVPPPVVVQAPPEMVLMPEAGVYVAVGTPYDLFFIGGQYYYFHNGYWYGARGYGGPWVHVGFRALPTGLRKYKIERLHEFRERAWNGYRDRGPAFRGHHFRDEERVLARGQHEASRRYGEMGRNRER